MPTMTTHSLPRLSSVTFSTALRGLLAAFFVSASAFAQPASKQSTPKTPVSDELIVNGELIVEKGRSMPDGWKARGGNVDLVKVIPKTDGAKGGVFEFSTKNAGVQQVVVIGSSWRQLELRFRMKTENVVPGDAPWKNARMALRFIDDAWKPIAPWPKNVGKSGTHDWTQHEVTIAVPPGATSLVIEPAMFGDHGTVWFSDISLRVIEAN